LLLKEHVTISQCGGVLVQLHPSRMQMETPGDGDDAVMDAAAAIFVA
jgi:hypothetical protein